MVTYFDKLRDAEIGGGDFTNVSGDYVGGDGVRRGADESKERSDPVSYFPNAKGLVETSCLLVETCTLVVHNRRPPQYPQFSLAQCHLVPSAKVTVETHTLIPVYPKELCITKRHHRNKVFSSPLDYDFWPD